MDKYSFRMTLLGILCLISIGGVVGYFTGYEILAIVGAVGYILTLVIYWGLYRGCAVFVILFETILFLCMFAFGSSLFDSAMISIISGIALNSTIVILYLKSYINDPWSIYISIPI